VLGNEGEEVRKLPLLAHGWNDLQRVLLP
jgi:hypothetical protein